MIQHDLDGNPVMIGMKTQAAVRQYPFSSETIGFLDMMNMLSGIPKQELVSFGVKFLAILMKLYPQHFNDYQKNKDSKAIDILNIIQSQIPKEINTLKPEDLDKIIQDILSKIKGI